MIRRIRPARLFAPKSTSVTCHSVEIVLVRCRRASQKTVSRIGEKKRTFSENRKPSGNNNITLARARDEFGVTEEDLKDLDCKLMRSPYEDGELIKVYLEDDIIRIASQKVSLHGQHLLQNDVEKFKLRQNERMSKVDQKEKSRSEDAPDESSNVIAWQITGNASIFVLKTIFAIQSGSASMMSESIHSACDTVNALVLYYGVQTSKRSPSVEHPYGYENMRYVTSLVSGVGIFCLGAGISCWHGLQSAMVPHELDADFSLAYLTLALSAGIDFVVLMKAVITARSKAARADVSLYQYVKEGSDPSVNVVLLEDSAAVAGCVVAGGCMFLAKVTQNHYFDATGSMLVGGMLGYIAVFLMNQNARYLIGKSIPQEVVLEIQDHLEARETIKGVYDMKATYIGPNIIRLKAEIDIDGTVIATQYLDQLQKNSHGKHLADQTNHIVSFKSSHQQRSATKVVLIDHINGGVDHVGKEIDRIELSIKTKFPEIKHVDLEVL